MEEQDNREYISKQIHPIFEKLLLAILAEKPPDIVSFMMYWLNNEGQQFKPKQQMQTTLSFRPKDPNTQRKSQLSDQPSKFIESLPQNVENQEKELLIHEDQLSQIVRDDELISQEADNPLSIERQQENQFNNDNTNNNNIFQNIHISHNNQEDHQHNLAQSAYLGPNPLKDPEQVKPSQIQDDIPQEDSMKQSIKIPRNGVSSEVYGEYNKKSDFQPKIIPKTKEQKQRIMKRLQQSFIFRTLNDKEKEIILQAMEENKFKAKQFIIKQGDDGDHLFVVDQGLLDCTRQFKQNGENKFLKSYQPGDSFGELALLYNTKRAANIQAKTDCVLWSLDRNTFNHIVKDAVIKKREEFDQILQEVDILSSMDPYERQQISEAINVIHYQANDIIFNQGEKGDMFYFIQKGELVALRAENEDDSPVEVLKYKPGDYFGELALMKEQPRQATIQCKTDCVLLGLDRQSFKRLLGPIDELLKRRTERYKQYSYF